jgi:uncharacterized protein Veg
VPTRWSTRHDALHAERYKYSDILKTLTKIILTSKLKAEIDEAKALKKTLETYETVFLIVLESKILQIIIDVVSKLLQRENQNIGQAAKLFTYQQMKELRTQFVELNNTAKTLAAKWGTSTKFIQKRASRPKLFFDESRNSYQIETGEDFFRINVFLRTVDK